MRSITTSCLFFVFFLSPNFSSADELGGGATSSSLQPVSIPRGPMRMTITVPAAIKESNAVNSTLRPKVRPASLAMPVPRQGFLAPGEVYSNPPGLPGINVMFNRSCQNFISEDGSIGPWGKEFLEGMKAVDQSEGTNCFSGGIDFGQRCPGFKDLSKSQMDHVWVWLWASTAQAESSCQTDAQVNGIYNARLGRFNTADGLMQLEYRTETRNANGRDTKFCPNSADSQAVSFQARCSAHIMARKQCPGFLKDEGSYWLKMGKDEGTIWDLLKKHPLCGGK